MLTRKTINFVSALIWGRLWLRTERVPKNQKKHHGIIAIHTIAVLPRERKMGQLFNKRAMSVLGACHVAGMLDLIALPVWIGALVEFYRLSPIQAGSTVTLFLAGIVVASVVTAPLFERIRHRRTVTVGFAISGGAFAYLATAPVGTVPFSLLLLIHAIGGLASGTAVSITHGTIGRSANPHRLFGLANVAMSAIAVVFFASVPDLIHKVGAQMLFWAFAAIMALAAATALVGFPRVEHAARTEKASIRSIPDNAWLIILTIICLTFNQALVFSFVERIGNFKGFLPADVGFVLICVGFFNLLPGALAALMQKRLSPIAVGIGGPVVQASFAFMLVSAYNFSIYAAFTIPYAAIVIFTHTFLFGLLARVDDSGRAVTATPAMMMIGSATGPAVGGMIVTTFGYPGLGYMAVIMAGIAVVLMLTFKIRSTSVIAVARSV